MEKELESPYSFHGGQARYLLKDYATMKGCIRSTVSQYGKAQKPALKAGDPTDGAHEEDNEFTEVERCLMIFGAPKCISHADSAASPKRR